MNVAEANKFSAEVIHLQPFPELACLQIFGNIVVTQLPPHRAESPEQFLLKLQIHRQGFEPARPE